MITYYTDLINKLIPQLQEITQNDYQAIQTEIADLRHELSKQLKNFGHNRINEYFNEAMEHAESDQELYALSNAYETMLIVELQRIKGALHDLRTH
ncbi:hypothetical protein [Spirosoma areae]